MSIADGSPPPFSRPFQLHARLSKPSATTLCPFPHDSSSFTRLLLGRGLHCLLFFPTQMHLFSEIDAACVRSLMRLHAPLSLLQSVTALLIFFSNPNTQQDADSTFHSSPPLLFFLRSLPSFFSSSFSLVVETIPVAHAVALWRAMKRADARLSLRVR